MLNKELTDSVSASSLFSQSGEKDTDEPSGKRFVYPLRS